MIWAAVKSGASSNAEVEFSVLQGAMMFSGLLTGLLGRGILKRTDPLGGTMALQQGWVEVSPRDVMKRVLDFAEQHHWELLDRGNLKRPEFPPPGVRSTQLYFWKMGGAAAGGQRIAVSIEPYESGGSVVVVKTQAKANIGAFSRAH